MSDREDEHPGTDDRPPTSAAAIGKIKEFVDKCKTKYGIDLIQSGKREEFASKVKPAYDYWFWTSSRRSKGDWLWEGAYSGQRNYLSDVHVMMSCFRSFKEIYAENPDTAKEIYDDIMDLRKDENNFMCRRAADLLGVYFFKDDLGFPSVHDFRERPRWEDEEALTDQEAVLLFDDDDYNEIFGKGYSDPRFQVVNDFISKQTKIKEEKLQEEQKRLQEEQAAEQAWRPVCRALANWKSKGYVLKWNESKSEYELWAQPGSKTQYGLISSVKLDEKMRDSKSGAQRELYNLKKEIKEAYDDAKAHKRPPKETMEKMIEEEGEKLDKAPQVNQTLQTQGGGVAVNSLDEQSPSVYDNKKGRV
ncbi:MAG: hypothetical protein IKJ28_06650 [Alphaproteobacteria bacterium]|nr:hypothetical protein [Alphaproteobacteria bacterium]